MLNHEIYGDGPTTLVIAHGLFGSARNWRAIAKRLSADMRVITVDMRNHGASFWGDDNSYEALADDLLKVADHFGPVRLLGHSMGGKAAMVAALADQSSIERLIVADIAPVAYAHSQTPKIDAMQAVDLSRVSARSDADALLKEHEPDPALRAFFLQSLVIDDTGARWAFNLDRLRADMDKIIGFPEVSGTYEKPAFFVTGRDSDYVDAAGKQRIRSLFPAARFVALKEAGHWLHADQPKPFIETIKAYLLANLK